VKAVARILGKPNVCLLALDPNRAETLKLDSKSTLTANDCAVFSNSTSTTGVAVKKDSMLKASTICAAGGVDQDGIISPAPFTDCPQFNDPLAGRSAPPVESCSHQKLAIKNETRSISPGVYCGGLTIDGHSVVTAEPGIYVFKGGTLAVGGTSTFKGVDVSFYFDADAALKVGKNTQIDLAATRTGALAGLLFFGARNPSPKIKHEILSKNAQKLLGTIYFPESLLSIGTDYGPGAAVGGGAAYTAIVARQILIKNKSVVSLNSDYDATDVPVPAGIRGAAQPVSLVK
jgi:hypothetical protein